MPTRWTEKLVDQQATQVDKLAATTDLLLRIEDTGLTDISPQTADVWETVASTGQELQSKLKANPMEHINRSPKEFSQSCKAIYDKFGKDFTFKVLLLATDPLHFSVARTEHLQQKNQLHRHYLGIAQPVRIEVGQGAVYSLHIQVIGARVSEVLQESVPGLSLAASVNAKQTVSLLTEDGLQAGCEGSQIQSLSDLKHLATVLSVTDELSAHRPSRVLQRIRQQSNHSVADLQTVAHVHDLTPKGAQQLGKEILSASTTVTPLSNQADGSDTILIDPQLTDQVVVIPLWDELRSPAAPSVTQLEQQVLSSLSIGILSTFGLAGSEQLTTQLITTANKGEKVTLQDMGQIQRL